MYDGILSKRCPCHSAHKTFKGLTQENDFISSSTVSFWARVLSWIAEFIGHQSLSHGGFSANLEPIHEGLSRVFSLAASSSSWSTFYRSWLTGDLTRPQLLKYATPGTWTSIYTVMQLFLWTHWPLCRSLFLHLFLCVVGCVL